MRVGGFLSVAIHVAIVAAGLVVAPALKSDPTPMIIIPLDLVTISDSTNIAPVTEKAKEDDKAEEKPQPEPQPQAASAAPPPPPPETFVPDASTPPPKKEADKNVDTKQPEAPKQPDKKDYLKTLNGILSSVDDKPAKTQRTANADKATNLRTVGDAAPRVGAGDMTRMTATVADFIRAQLLANGCWTDHDDMADARRLKAVIRVRFLASGHFLGEPELIDPREPSSDPPMQAFVGFARTALDKCNRLGFRVPPEYYKVQPAQYIDITFLP